MNDKYEVVAREDIDGCQRAAISIKLPQFEWLAFTEAKAVSYRTGETGETVVAVSCKDGDSYAFCLDDLRKLLKEAEDLVAMAEAVRDA